ncbi:MAG: hypothetical protein LRY37_03095 [Alkalibacterium thalassium]|nr:hypothetical protein [Alkalibacterium thalassium]
MFEINFTFRLKPINWNDYGFNTHYLLFYKTTDSDRFKKIGRILIIDPIKAAEKKEDKPYYNEIEGGVPFEGLPSNFISLGASEDYYLAIYNLSQTYPGIKEAIKQNLGDIVMNNEIEKYTLPF